MWSNDLGTAEISFVIIYTVGQFVKGKVRIFQDFFGDAKCGVKKMGIPKSAALFFIGGASYMGMELLWRGWTHGSMFFAGGTCFLLLGGLHKVRPQLPLLPRGIVGAGVITSVELLVGLIANRDYGVWDYRNVPMNFHGQICLPFSLLWVPISLGGMALYGWLDKKILPAV